MKEKKIIRILSGIIVLIIIGLAYFIYQNNENAYADYEEKTRKHMMEMEALVLQNRYLSTFGKKILYSRGFAGKFKNRGKDDLYC